MSKKWYQKANMQVAIISGIFIIAASIITGLFNLHKTDLEKENGNERAAVNSESNTQKLNASNSKTGQDPGYKYLSENQIRVEISNSLRSHQVDNAIELTKSLSSIEKKNEEYEHIFNYCIKSGNLDKAEIVANLYTSAVKKEQAKEIIVHEKIKMR